MSKKKKICAIEAATYSCVIVWLFLNQPIQILLNHEVEYEKVNESLVLVKEVKWVYNVKMVQLIVVYH
jgi:hypothetical protein